MNKIINTARGIAILFIGIASVYANLPKGGYYDDIISGDMEKTLIAIEYNSRQEEQVIPPEDTLQQSEIKRIVVHHTATNPDQDINKLFAVINNNHGARWIKGGINKKGQQMMYHRLIGSNGIIVGDKPMDEIGWGTKVNNIGTIHIALQGDFTKKRPTDIQYEKLKEVIYSLEVRYGKLEILGHGEAEGEATACPGPYLDMNKLRIEIHGEKIQDIPTTKDLVDTMNTNTEMVKKGYKLFSLSRYYSPLPGQTRYYDGRTYAQDVTMNCGETAIGNDGCFYPASGIRYTMANKNTSVACPPEYPLGTKIELQLRAGPHVVTCEDRGSAIVANRIDMYCGIGDYALDHWNTCITGNIYGKVL